MEILDQMGIHFSQPALTTGRSSPCRFPLFTTFDTSHEFLMQKMARFVDGFPAPETPTTRRAKPAGPPSTPRL
jgi:hypothetical protein